MSGLTYSQQIEANKIINQWVIPNDAPFKVEDALFIRDIVGALKLKPTAPHDHVGGFSFFRNRRGMQGHAAGVGNVNMKEAERDKFKWGAGDRVFCGNWSLGPIKMKDDIFRDRLFIAIDNRFNETREPHAQEGYALQFDYRREPLVFRKMVVDKVRTLEVCGRKLWYADRRYTRFKLPESAYNHG